MKKLVTIMTVSILFSLLHLAVSAKPKSDTIDHNASRSNNTNSVTAKPSDSNYPNPPSKANDWNSTRSNKTSKNSIKVIANKKKKKSSQSKD